MHASDLQEDYPTIEVTAEAVEAARTIGGQRRPAIVVVDAGRPVAVLPGSQVLTFLIPAYLREDASLVRVYDEKAADACAERLAGKTVGDLLPKPGKRAELPVIAGDANVLECAALMTQLHSPLLVVIDDGEQMTGVVTASRILESLAP